MPRVSTIVVMKIMYRTEYHFVDLLKSFISYDSRVQQQSKFVRGRGVVVVVMCITSLTRFDRKNLRDGNYLPIETLSFEVEKISFINSFQTGYISLTVAVP